MPIDHPKKSCSAISVSLKHQIYEWSNKNKNKKQKEIAFHFNEQNPTLNIDCSTISKILTQSEKWSTILEIEGFKKIYRQKEVKFLELNRAMSL